MRALLKVFVRLLVSIRSYFAAVFIIVDGLKFYEGEDDYFENASRLVKALLEFIKKSLQ